MTEIEWLGEENQLSIDIFNRKYRYNNEDFEQWLDRVSGGDVELRQLIKEKKFLFGGRTLSNRGVENSGSYFNCYSLGFVEDDYKQILQTAMDMGLTYKAQGGQGVSLTNIRPKGTPIGTRYESDGIVPFMKIFNTVTEETSQGGARKGALMISIDARHKEAETFITLKNQKGVVEKANLSLEIDDEFMDAVKAFYETGQEIVLHEHRSYGTHEVDYDIVPIRLYKKIVNNCYEWGDPACLFVNRFRNYNLMEFDPDYNIEICNPCFTGDMKLLTANGYKTFLELNNTEFDIVNIDGKLARGKVWSNGEKEVVRVIFWDDSEIVCTPDHIFMSADGEEFKAKDLKNIKLMPFNASQKRYDTEYIKLGFLQGDGQLNRLNSLEHDGLDVNIGANDGDILDLFSDDEYKVWKDGRHIYLYNYSEKLRNLGFSPKTMETRVFPKSYNDWTKHQKASFLQGCYSANGTVLRSEKKGSCRVGYKTICKEFAEQLCETLINDFDICAYITTNKPRKVTFNNGEYLCKESYDINIGKYQDIVKFYSEINFYQLYKKIRLSNIVFSKAPVVRRVESAGIQSVYDFHEPETHWGIVNGFIAHNCGEQPLPKNFCCNLGSLNLSEFVENPFSEKSTFNILSFKKAISIAVRGLDVLIDENSNNHPLEAQRINSLNYRNIGLGVMGYATALMKLGITYGSEHAKEFTGRLFQILFKTAIKSSVELAKEKGAFPNYSPCVFDSTIIQKYSGFEKSEITKMKKTGIRNCSLISIAPTGTLSTLLNVTGGAEPEYNISYKRKTESLVDNKEKYYDVFCNTYKEYMNYTGKADMPEYFITSHDIYWKDRIDTQAIMQDYVDTAISSTVNLSQETPIEEVEKLYVYAWEKGLKGITIFRDGCKRTGILTTEPKDVKPIEQIEELPTELKRGIILQINDDVVGKKRKLVTGCGSLHCVAFFDPDTGDLVETYLSKGSTGGCNNFMIGLSRMISLSARSGCDVHTIANQLNSCGVCPSYAVRRATKDDTSKGASCPIAIGNALLEMYAEMIDEIGLKDEWETTPLKKSGNYCPECDEPLSYEGGCNICKSCGWSKCG